MLERMTCSGEEDIYVAEAQSEWRKGQEVEREREVRAVVHARLQGCDFILGWGRGGSGRYYAAESHRCVCQRIESLLPARCKFPTY